MKDLSKYILNMKVSLNDEKDAPFINFKTTKIEVVDGKLVPTDFEIEIGGEVEKLNKKIKTMNAIISYADASSSIPMEERRQCLVTALLNASMHRDFSIKIKPIPDETSEKRRKKIEQLCKPED